MRAPHFNNLEPSMSKNLLAALKGLDPNNDNHWTADGSPRLETVRLLAGDAHITRDVVTAAAPGLSRATVADLQGAPEPVQGGSTTPAAETAPAPVQGPSSGGSNGEVEGSGAGDGADTQDQPSTGGGTDELAAAQQEHAEALAAHGTSTRRLEAATKALDLLLEARDAARVRKAVGAATVVRDYLTRQGEIAAERGRRQAALKGINLADILPTKAKIDTALARRDTRATRRPTQV